MTTPDPSNLDPSAATEDFDAAGAAKNAKKQFDKLAANNPFGEPGDGKPRQKVIAMLLAFFLGCFGIHNFYLGYTKTAKQQLTIGLVGFVVSWLPVVSVLGSLALLVVGVWALYNLFCIATARGQYATDAAGNALV